MRGDLRLKPCRRVVALGRDALINHPQIAARVGVAEIDGFGSNVGEEMKNLLHGTLQERIDLGPQKRKPLFFSTQSPETVTVGI